MKHGLHYENATAASLGLVRASVFALWLGLFAYHWPGVIAPVPELFVTRGIWLLLPRTVVEWLISPQWMAIFPWVFVPSVLAAALGLKPFRLWGPLALLCILILDGWYMGLSSFVYHARGLALVMTGVLVCSPSADGFAIGGGSRARTRCEASAYGFPLLLMLVVALLCYTMVGVHRFARGDYRVFDAEVVRAWLLMRGQGPFTYGLVVANSPWMLWCFSVGFFICTVLEVISLACLRWRTFAYGWLIFFSIFHFLSLLSMNIFFWENTILLWLLFVPLGAWMRTRESRSPRSVS
jgi:hypothetical protein